MFLARFGEDHILFDAGAPGNGQLRLVALTHGHSDHVGAMQALVQKHPDVQAVFHQDEAPYITGPHAHLVLGLQCCIP